MNTFLKQSLICLWLLISVGCTTKPARDPNPVLAEKPDTLATLTNDTSKVVFSLFGGALVSFQHKTNTLNPFNWKMPEAEMPENNRNGAVFQGQYLSIGRWGNPTPGEIKLGMPMNGEASNNWWKQEQVKNPRELRMNCEAPLDGFGIKREVKLSPTDALIKVSETITNELSICRPLVFVQNIPFATPFLSSKMLIHSNATSGFNQVLAQRSITAHEYHWPMAYVDTLKIAPTDITRSIAQVSYVSSHIFPDSLGWVTVANPSLRMLVGYAWKTTDYPWLHIENTVTIGKNWTKGISFGNTGLNDKFSVSDRMATSFHKVKNVEMIDAKSSIRKTYYCFLLAIPTGFVQTLDIKVTNDVLKVRVSTASGIREYKLTL